MVSHICALCSPAPAQSEAGLAFLGQGLTVVEYQMQNCLGSVLCDSMLTPCPIVSLEHDVQTSSIRGMPSS